MEKMIKVGKKTKAKYWGNFTVEKVIKLDSPVKCFSNVKGEVFFNPTIVKISWEQEPSDDKHDLRFPYWISIDGKEKYGQYAPMIGQKTLLKLLSSAIDNDLFDKSFLEKLNGKIMDYLRVKA
jgi:hypothetical protein